jgi:diketogulonate reductase-like aldo/keto reductase
MQDSLDFLGMEYVDLYLIHNPRWVPEGHSLSEAWNEMREVRKEGWAKSIGVSK